MIKFKLINNFNTKKKIVVIALLVLALIFILGNYNREAIKSYINEVVKSPSTRIHLINIAKVAIPIKNLIFDGTTPESLLNGLERFFEDPKFFYELKSKCRETAEKYYSWEKVTDQTEEEFIKIIKTSNL